MAYCRIGRESDVYLYVTDNDDGLLWVCHFCSLTEPLPSGDEPATLLQSPQEAMEHLHRHRNAGDKVPQAAFDRLRMEMER